MASPSITQFFKTQRKRPRTGKDEIVASANKKLLLEGGAVSKMGGDEVLKSVKTEEMAPLKADIVEKLVNTEKSKSTEERKKKKASGTIKKKSSKVAEAGETNILTFAKPVKAKTAEVETVTKQKEQVAEPEQGQGGDKSNVVLELQPAPVMSKDTGVASPVKFLKLGSLSPTKKKKNLTAQQVAKLLKGKKKLGELQAALAGVNQCRKNIEEFRRKGETTRLMSPMKPTAGTGSMGAQLSASKTGITASQFYSPTADRSLKSDLDRLSASKVTGSPSKLVSMNNKVKKRLFEKDQNINQSDKKVPAYQRFHNLAEKTAVERGIPADEVDLPLPYHFKVLKELFIAVETVAAIMKQRKEIMVFPKLKSGVLELVKKVALRESHLAQMVTVLPGCYTFSLEKVGKDTHIKLDVEDLVPSVVCQRRKDFHSALIKICLEHHQKFLLGLVPPIVVPSDKQITRWHPTFKVDEVPGIVPHENALPIKPTAEKTSSARDVIAKAQNIFENANPRMKQALKNMLVEKQAEEKTADVPVQAPGKIQPAPKCIKGVSQSLLEKIRNREKQKLLNEMTRSPAESKKIQMMRKLPNFVKIIRNMFVAEKKVALPMDIVVDRVSHSIQNMAPVDADTHIRLMVTLLPQWSKIVKLSHSDSEYLRIDKNADINSLLDDLNEIIKKNCS